MTSLHRQAGGPSIPSRAMSPVSVADAAEAHLRSLLFSGEFRAGEVLRDTSIAQQLGIARPTARIAVQRLTSEGLLERQPGHSARVRIFTEQDIKDIYQVRRMLEFEAVRIITLTHRPTAAIEQALTQFERMSESWEAGPDSDVRFHSAVVESVHSPRLSKMFASLVSEMRLLIGLLKSRYRNLDELYEEHALLLRSLQDGDTDAALELWAAHIDDAEHYITMSLRNAT